MYIYIYVYIYTHTPTYIHIVEKGERVRTLLNPKNICSYALVAHDPLHRKDVC